MVTAASICDDLHARECQSYVRGQRREKLFTGLCRQHGIVQQQRRIAKAASSLPSDLSNLWWQAMLLNSLCAFPGFEVPCLPVAQQTCLDNNYLDGLIQLAPNEENHDQCRMQQM